MKQKDTNLIRSNVFQATEDSYVSGAILDDEALFNSTHHKLAKKSNGKYVILDPLAPDFKDIVLDRGEAQAPDEILDAIKPLALKIPLLGRDDFGSEELPTPNLLRSIHLYSNHAKMVNYSLDETALLALGMAAELWADELLGNGDALMYVLEDTESKINYFPPESLDYEDLADECEDFISSSEEEVLPPELLESDTDEEILEIRSKRQKLNNLLTLELNKDSSGSDDSSSQSSSDSESSSDSNEESTSEPLIKATKPVAANENESDTADGIDNLNQHTIEEAPADSPNSEVDTSLYDKYDQTVPNLDFYDSEVENQDDESN